MEKGMPVYNFRYCRTYFPTFSLLWGKTDCFHLCYYELD